MYAFENGLSHHVNIPGRFFIGVNIHPLQNMTIIETHGHWSYGKL